MFYIEVGVKSMAKCINHIIIRAYNGAHAHVNNAQI